MGRRSDARARLVASAGDLFRARGFSSVGVAQLCDASGVNKGSFYHFFPSKRDLLLEALDAAWDETGLLRAWEETPPEGPLEQLRQYLEELFAQHYADRESSGRVRGSLVANVAHEVGSHEPLVARKLEALLQREIRAFAVLLNRANQLGEVSLDNAENAAEALVACLHGLLMLAKVTNELQVIPRSESHLLRLAGAGHSR